MTRIATRQSDERLLEILHLKENEGLTVDQIAERFRVGRGSISGAISRVNRSHLPCSSLKPENKNGGMPKRWWK